MRKRPASERARWVHANAQKNRPANRTQISKAAGAPSPFFVGRFRRNNGKQNPVVLARDIRHAAEQSAENRPPRGPGISPGERRQRAHGVARPNSNQNVVHKNLERTRARRKQRTRHGNAYEQDQIHPNGQGAEYPPQHKRGDVRPRDHDSRCSGRKPNAA